MYFISTFLAYTDPRYDGINQEGLVPKCKVYLVITLYISTVEDVEIVTKDVDMEVTLSSKSYAVFKFFAPEKVDHVFLTIVDSVSCKDCDFFNVRIQPHNVPSMFKSIKSLDIPVANFSRQNYSINIWTPENAWYYLRFQFTQKTFSLINGGFFTFRLKFFLLPELINENVTLNLNNSNFDTYVPDPVFRLHRDGNISNIMSYNEYDLVRERNSDNFVYGYDLRPKKNGKIPLYINATNDKFTVLKFVIQDSTDSGGTAQFHLAVKPRAKYVNGKRIVETDPENNQVVACIRKGVRELPLWPHNCFFNNISQPSPIFVNKTVENASVMIPYPEPGTWFISIRLFCGSCESCNCSNHCQHKHETCMQVCEENCEPEQCNNCTNTCRQSVIEEDECRGCDCIGGCKRNNINCNTSIVFEVASFSCVDGTCGDNGKCVFSISEGFVVTSCFCTNNYRGWECSDNSQANPYSAIVVEMVLLTLSNLMFVPAVYLAIKRHYYIESLTYTLLCLSSTFYHACDAGENIISYCLIRLNILLFSVI
ncbi:post-GPI attachment to proteins factor 6-like [Agrilus planipennis]|uniref:Post-GPI attachment to proteins factor 6-like n=1 Tax=Agrilus planipennis TaxID=224129 RepID=A0A7F5QVQ3_AGRPL|nr:post-GPI attachment to proteins factor 6-like [Agrilus planipennis]